MNSQTARLLRQTAGGNRQKYKLLKKAYKSAPQYIRATGKAMARELAQVERAEKEISEMLAKKKELEESQAIDQN